MVYMEVWSVLDVGNNFRLQNLDKESLSGNLSHHLHYVLTIFGSKFFEN